MSKSGGEKRDSQNILLSFTMAASFFHSPPRLCGFLSSSRATVQAYALNHINFALERQVGTSCLLISLFIWKCLVGKLACQDDSAVSGQV